MTDPMQEMNKGPAPRDRRRDTRLVAMGVIAVLLVWFGLANLKSVKIDFWIYHATAPLIVVIIISGLLGAGVALLAIRHRRAGSSHSH